MMKGKDGLNSEARTGSIDPAWSEVQMHITPEVDVPLRTNECGTNLCSLTASVRTENSIPKLTSAFLTRVFHFQLNVNFQIFSLTMNVISLLVP
jgi:hypothetical protein